MGFLDDLVDIARSMGEVNKELNGIKSDIVASFSDVTDEAKKLIETAKGNDTDELVGKDEEGTASAES